MDTYLRMLLAVAGGVILLLAGCVRRTISITSDPPGALVYLNDAEVGRTPVDVDFTHYGDYDVRLVQSGFEPLVTHAAAKPPVWDMPPFDLAAELYPARTTSRISWHFVLEPRDDDEEALLQRARALRARLPESPPETADQPDDPES